jgi:transketolase
MFTRREYVDLSNGMKKDLKCPGHPEDHMTSGVETTN